MSRPHPSALTAVVLSAALAVGACETTIEPTATTLRDGSITSTTSFVAEGSTTDLLEQLVEEATGLSETIVQNEGDEDLIARIDMLWTAARPGVEEATPDLLHEFERAITMMDSAVTRRRHADADKALNNLRNLIAALPPLD